MAKQQQSIPVEPSSTNQTGGCSVFLYRSAVNGNACIYRQQIDNKSVLSVESLQNSFGDVINEKKEKFCKAEKHDEYTDLPVVLKSNALTFLEGTDILQSL